MRKTREVLRLKMGLGLTARQVAGSVGLARSTAGEYLRRTEAAGLSRQEIQALSDGELEEKLFPPSYAPSCVERPLPDWAEVKHELRRTHVTLYLLWREYQITHPEGYGRRPGTRQKSKWE